MKKFFKWLSLLIVLLALAVAVFLFNPGLFKGQLEQVLSNVSGYTIRLEGELEIYTGRLLRITATNIRIAAPDWASRRDLASAGYLDLTLETASLFADSLVIDSLQTNDLQINLETREDGSANWSASVARPAAQDDDDRDPVVIINSVLLSNVDLRFLNGKSGVDQHLNVVSMDQKQLSNGMLQATLTGSLNGRPVAFGGSVGPYSNLLKGRDIAYEGNGNFGDLRFNAKGLIDDLLKPRYPQFHLNMQGPSIDEITAMFGIHDLGSGEFSLLARGERVNNQYEAGIDGRIGNISLGITAYASDLTGLDELDLGLTANGPSLDAVMRIFGVEHWPDKPFSIKGGVERVGSTLNVSRLTLAIGGTEMVLDALLTKFPSFDASRVRLSIQGDDVEQFRELLGIGGIATGPFELKGSLDVNPQEVELLQLEFRTSLGSMVISGTLGDAPNYSGSKLDLHLDGNNAHMLMSLFDIDLMPEAAFNLNAQIESTDSGLKIERAVLVTENNERLELDGFVSFEPGSLGTDVSVKVNSKHLQRLLSRLNTGIEVPDVPYEASGQVKILEQGVQLDGVQAEFADIQLAVDGLLMLRERFIGTGLDIRIDGENITSLSTIPALADTVDLFIPDQPYQVSGHLEFANAGWKLDRVTGRLGATDVALDGLVANQPGGAGSDIGFSVSGPDLHGLFANRDGFDLPEGNFDASGQVSKSDDSISIKNFNFVTPKTRGNVELELALPVDNYAGFVFDLNIAGDDLRQILPKTNVFEPAKSSFSIVTAGHRQDGLISVKNFDAEIGDLQLSLSGRVDDDPSNESFDLTFSAAADDLSGLGLLNGDPLPSIGLDLKAQLDGSANRLSFHKVSGKLGEADISGNIEIGFDGPRPKIALDVSSQTMDLRPFLRPAEDEDTPSPAANLDRVIPPTPLPLETLAAADLTLKLDVHQLLLQRETLNNLKLNADTQDGKLNVSKLVFESGRGSLVSSLSVTPTTTNRADVVIEASAKSVLLNLLKAKDNDLLQVPRYDIELQATGNGSNLQELAGSLNGTYFMGSEGGKLRGLKLGLLDTFILEEILTLIMPNKKQDEVLTLNCAAIGLKLTDGLMETDPALAITTDNITLVSKGTLDLKTEKIHLNFNATPTNVLMISPSELVNPYILVSGTLAKPIVGLDPAKTLLHGGAAIGTAGISIVAKGLLDRLGSANPLCEEMLESARQTQ